MKLRSFLYNEEGAGGGGGSGAPPAAPAAPAAPAQQGTLLTSEAPAGGAPSVPPPAPPPSDWKAGLPPVFGQEAALAPFMGFDDQAAMLEALGKSYLETKRLVGAKAPARPLPDAAPEEWAKWRKLVGAPDDEAGYGETLRPEDFPEEMWSKDFEKEARALFHKHNLTPEAARDLAAMHARLVNQGLDQSLADDSAKLQQESQALRTKWGTEFAQNAHEAATFAKTVGLSPDDPIFREGKYVEAMFAAARLIGEKTLPVGKVQSSTGGGEIWLRQTYDPNSGTPDSRAFHGEFGPERQAEVQARMFKVHEEMDAQGIPYRT